MAYCDDAAIVTSHADLRQPVLRPSSPEMQFMATGIFVRCQVSCACSRVGGTVVTPLVMAHPRCISPAAARESLSAVPAHDSCGNCRCRAELHCVRSCVGRAACVCACAFVMGWCTETLWVLQHILVWAIMHLMITSLGFPHHTVGVHWRSQYAIMRITTTPHPPIHHSVG